LGAFSTAARIVGTAEIVTGCNCSTVSQNFDAENRSHMTTSQRIIIGIRHVTTWAFAWNSGSSIPTRSPAPSGTSSAPWVALTSRLRWVSIAPFGLPVVPDV
jgi:hypothetical protein